MDGLADALASCAEGLPDCAGGSTRTGGMRDAVVGCRRVLGARAASVYRTSPLRMTGRRGCRGTPPDASDIFIQPLAGLLQAYLECAAPRCGSSRGLGSRRGSQRKACFYNSLSSILCGPSATRRTSGWRQWPHPLVDPLIEATHWADRSRHLRRISQTETSAVGASLSSPKVSFSAPPQ